MPLTLTAAEMAALLSRNEKMANTTEPLTAVTKDEDHDDYMNRTLVSFIHNFIQGHDRTTDDLFVRPARKLRSRIPSRTKRQAG